MRKTLKIKEKKFGSSSSGDIVYGGFGYLCYVSLQYDFPKQEAVIQFVIDAIQAEAFNPRTLFLIGSYTIGRFKSSLFLDIYAAYFTMSILPFHICLKYVVI